MAAPDQAVLVIPGVIAPPDVPLLCERVDTVLEASGGTVVWCDVSAVLAPDMCTVDALARLQLTARRVGARIWLRAARPELLELLDLVGLRRVCGAGPATPRGEAGGRTSERASGYPGKM